MSSSYTTFRVRGIPAGTSKENVEALVKEALASEDSSVFRLKSLANDHPRSREMVATMNFFSIPAQLARCASGAEWSAELSDDISLLFDTHFYGCTTLFCPPEDSWRFDVFAISGLNGHAFGSFKKKNESYMWLRDALRRDFPESRIVIYGYDSTLQDSKSFQNILDIGHKFRSALAEARPGKEKKPLILVGHSLGGIVVKQAINDMRISELDQDRENFAAICGIVFFGVPNQGMDIHSLVPMVGDQPNRGLLQNLEHNSPTLRIQAKDFSAALGDLRCDVLNFYETQESPTAQQDESGKWSMTGPSAVLVNPFSATHGRPDDTKNHRAYPIDRGHSDLVKFPSPHDEAYKTLVAYLNGIDISGIGSQPAMSKVQAGCLRSLGFPEQYQRMDSLEPEKGTCYWLTKHKYFVQWLANPKGFLWIRGMPGSGKSMAMKHMVTHVENLSTMNAVVASFFFHAQGVGLQKSLLGLYRSLLHQLYPHFLHVFSDLTARFKEYTEKSGKSREDWLWMSGEIRKYFMEGISTACKQKPIVLFVDAVDEAGESSARDLFRDLQQLLGSLSDHACQLRICLSCRNYPEIILESGKTLVMENHNYEDMERVVSTRIDRLPIFTESNKQQIKVEVLNRSGGIFQWTSLVVNGIVHERTQGNSFQAALEAVERIPAGLDSLYRALLQTGEQQCSSLEQRQRRALFHWLLFATRRLSPVELQYALALSQDKKQSSISDYKESSGFISEENFETRMRTLSKGLIQLRGSFDSGQVEFIHQSVIDFLTNRGGLRLLSNASDIEPIRFAHFEISRSCLQFLFMPETYEIPARLSEAPSTGLSFPFISYAWKNWIFHAVSAKNQDETTKHSDHDILEEFQWPNDQVVADLWVFLRKIIGCPLKSWKEAFWRDTPFSEDYYLSRRRTPIANKHKYIAEWPMDGWKWRHLFALCGLLDGSAGERMISEVASLESSTAGIALLIYAIVGQQKQVVRRLVNAGVRCRSYGLEYWRSPIHLACIWGDVEVISLLIKSRSSLATSEKEGYTPLHFAAAFGHQSAAEVLLRAGAKPNAKAGNGLTPLYLAGWNGHYETSKQLLKFRADPNAKDLFGDSLLCTVTLKERQDFIELLLSNGAKPDGEALYQAVEYSKGSDIVRLLLKCGIGANAKNRVGCTALFAAVEKENQGIAELLIASGADTNAMDAHLNAPLHLVKRHREDGTTRLLLQHGADPNIKDRLGCTPLIRAVEWLNYQIAQILLEAGADPNLKNDRGRTALMEAADASTYHGDKMEVIRLLLQFGADPTARSLSGITAYSDPKDEDIDKALREAGCPLDYKGGSKVREARISSWKSWGRVQRYTFRRRILGR